MESSFTLNVENGVVSITIAGRLDHTNAPAALAELEKLIGQQVNKVIFWAKDLVYIASSGLRVIIYAKKKINPNADVYIIGAQEEVLDVIQMTGLDNFLNGVTRI